MTDLETLFRSLPTVKNLPANIRERPVVQLEPPSDMSAPALDDAIRQAGYAAEPYYVIAHPLLGDAITNSARELVGGSDAEGRIEFLSEPELLDRDAWFLIGGERVMYSGGS